MSHIVSIQTRINDPVAITAACHRLGLAVPVLGKAQLFSGEASGLLLSLPGWQYPAVIDTATGEVKFDNFEGHWGDQVQLEKFLQAYGVEKTKIEARKKGYTVSEQTLNDGSIKVQLIEGGV